MRLPVGYPSPTDERTILNNLRREHPITSLQPVDFSDLLSDVTRTGNGRDAQGLQSLLEFQRQVWEVHMDETLQDYIIRLVNATRSHPDLALGGSPRASLALYKASQALAALRGRDHVLPDDIKYLAVPTLSHRLIARPEAELRGRTAAVILSEVLAGTRLEIGSLA